MSAAASALPERLRRATLVTGNPGKAAEARRLVGLELAIEELDLPEVQSLDLVEVLRAKAAEAHRRLGRPVLVDETSLELAALGGFPGPLVKWLLVSVGPAGLTRLARAFGSEAATARCALLLLDGQGEVLAVGSAEGELVDPRGEGGFGWDSVFRPLSQERTYAELDAATKDRIGHRGEAWRELVRMLGG